MSDSLWRRGRACCVSCLLAAAPFILLGCPAQPAATPESAAPTEGLETKEPETESGVEPDADAASDAETSSSPSQPEPEPAAGAEDGSTASDAEPAPGGEALPTSVVLGDESLYAGIPGEGPLTVEEIRNWLNSPGVHEELSITLPLGLSLGEKQITGLDENPLTRAKIELGRQLYFDGRLSSDQTISCASCHDPAQGWTAQTQFGVGVRGQVGNRNSPVSFNRILSGAQFWDGRAESLEAQAIGPIANPIEMGNSHDACVECLKGIEGYRIQFERIFGPDSLTIENVAKAIASFERAIVTGPSPYDYHEALKPILAIAETEEDLAELKEDDPELYAKYEELKAQAEAHPMSDSALRGRDLFFSDRVGCTACHVGANFTDEKYHNIGVGMDREEPDLGRYAVTGEEKDKGAFKTPTVRNVEFTAPYMHDGSQKTLEEVVEWYAKGGHPNPWLSEKIKKFEASEQDKKDLVAFMKSLSGPFPRVETGRLPQ